MPPTRVHFNGSVNLADAETVMREIVGRNPAGVQRIPDGETGERNNWIGFQLQKFMESPFLERPARTTTRARATSRCRRCGSPRESVRTT